MHLLEYDGMNDPGKVHEIGWLYLGSVHIPFFFFAVASLDTLS